MTSWRKTLLWTLAFFFFFATKASVFAEETLLDLNMGIGYRIDRLNWNIAGGGVNVLSELTWDDLRIHQIKGGGRFIVDEIEPGLALYVRGSAGYGQIVAGENQDSDFEGNNRTDEFSRSNNDADDGDVLDGSIGIGLQTKIRLQEKAWIFKIAPLVGYSYHEQNLKMTNGFQTVPSLGSFPGLNSSYKTEWKGPWAGIDLFLETDNQFTLFGFVEYHWPDYSAEANWNLRPQFQHPLSFAHVAEGEGLLASAGWEYRFLPAWTVVVALDYLNWSTHAGIETNFLSPQGIQEFFSETGVLVADGIVLTPLNEVNWESQSVTLGIVYRFK